MHAHADSYPAPRVVIVGGFLTSPLLYRPFRRRLLERGAADVRICPLWTPEWLLAAAGVGFGPLMRRAGTTIARAYREGDGRPLLVVGHSAGGILARLAMSPQPFEGRLAAVGPAVGALVTLGTPHHLAGSARRVLRVGWRAQQFLEAGDRCRRRPAHAGLPDGVVGRHPGWRSERPRPAAAGGRLVLSHPGRRGGPAWCR